MTECGNTPNATADKKAKIRERYKGISTDELDVIPALPAAGLDDEGQVKRVAVYARVSTDDPRQTSSYELQKNHYQDVVSRHPNWELTNIYADEGISGTSLMHRDSFLRMIEDCRAGKIDLILTKSVSRFARNIVDCISYIRQLRAMKPPIGVMFETEHIYTLDGNSDMSLSFIATLAQEESHTKSEIMNSSVEMRFRRGIFLTPALLGYDRDEDGNLVINEDEAMTVRLIFFMYLYGYTCQQIADKLISLKRPTKKGNLTWSVSTVLQHLLRNAKYKHSGILPQLSVTFKEKLGIISCKEITQEAKVRKAGSMGFTETFLNYYNKKTRFGLERAKLYKKQKGIGKEEGSAAADDAVVEAEPSSLSGKENPGGETAPRQMDLFDLPGST